MKIMDLVRDERGAATPSAIAAVLTAAAGGLALTHLAGHRHGELGLGLVGLAAGVVREKPDQLRMERNFARDTRAFRLPVKKDPLLATRKTVVGKNGKELQWQWKDDPRVIAMPIGAVKHLFYYHLARDVIAVATTLYLHGRHEGNKVVTSMRELCNILGLSVCKKNYQRLEETLTALRSITIYEQNVPLRQEKGKVFWGSRVFGFCDYAERIKEENGVGVPLPPAKQRVEIKLSDVYVQMIEFTFGKHNEKNMLCTIPVAALDATQNLAREHKVAAKNIIYYLAGRGGKATLTVEKIIDITGFHPRWRNEAERIVQNLLDAMEKAGIVTVLQNTKGNYKLKLNYRCAAIDVAFDVEPSPEFREEDLPF